LTSQLYVVSRLATHTVKVLEATFLDFLQLDKTQNLLPVWWSPEQFHEIVLDNLVGHSEEASRISTESARTC
jgi:hypothetical protein